SGLKVDFFFPAVSGFPGHLAAQVLLNETMNQVTSGDFYTNGYKRAEMPGQSFCALLRLWATMTFVILSNCDSTKVRDCAHINLGWSWSHVNETN
ncbi:MAG: hypothetical protein AAF485_23400, partial [Chloroflexota bacterium]